MGRVENGDEGGGVILGGLVVDLGVSDLRRVVSFIFSGMMRMRRRVRVAMC